MQYFSSHKKATVQDIKNRRLISAPAPPLSVLAGSKERPKTPFFETRESPILKGSKSRSLIKYVYLSQNKPRPLQPLKVRLLCTISWSLKFHVNILYLH